jgi:hypothetical protein
MALEYKMCSRCRCLYEDGDIENAFRITSLARYTSPKYKRAKCRPCEQRERDDKKAARRHRRKAYNTLINHYKKYKRLGFVGSRRDFAERYGWNLDIMEADLKRKDEEHICGECRLPFRVLDDITLDIREPDEPPAYGQYPNQGNTEWICRTCNQAKGTLTMPQWEDRKRIYRIWNEHQAKMARDPFYGTMFAGQSEQPGRKREWNGKAWQ